MIGPIKVSDSDRAGGRRELKVSDIAPAGGGRESGACARRL